MRLLATEELKLRIAILIWLAPWLTLWPGTLLAGEVVLHARDLVRLPSGIWQAPALALPDDNPDLPMVGDGVSSKEAAQILRYLASSGAAQGFGGILYDNRDRGHSKLKQTLFPRLLHLVYDLPLQSDGTDYGLAGAVFLPAVVFGNSSTAITAGPAPRSMTRFAMTRDGLPERMARLYENNHLYVHPEHRDHDEADLFPANWPYTLTSQGSSGSDQPFLEAIAMTLAAFPPETFARLREERLVVPTLQMILRRTHAGVESREDYLSSAGHPVVFDATRLRPGHMVELAASLGPEEIPPIVRLTVVEEDFAAEGGLARLDERLFDTPSAIARIWRGFEYEREMILSAEETADPNGRPLTFIWRLLQGDSEKVLIEPLDPEGRRARITIAWHDGFSTASGSLSRETSRVDIGVFASNGVADSAPAFVSVSFPTHQERLYGPAEEGGAWRLLSIGYDALGRDAYYDPELHWYAFWRDEAIYDEKGKRIAWRRSTSDGEESVIAGTPRDSDYWIDRTWPRTPVLRVKP
jgi:hypothetical protein